MLTTTRKAAGEARGEGVAAEDDAHVDDLLVTTAKVHGGHALVKAGEVILQDKSSCFPAHAAQMGYGRTGAATTSSCAAPGNKSTHAAHCYGAAARCWPSTATRRA